eukprot:6530798-Prymnesium_polylepis.2
MAASMARCRARSCCAREVNGHRRGALPSGTAAAPPEGPADEGPTAAEAGGAASCASGAIMSLEAVLERGRPVHPSTLGPGFDLSKLNSK